MKNEKDLDQIEKTLDFDPLSEAEKVTGKSYKEDKLTSSLGMLLHLDHIDKKRKLLDSVGDTQFSNKVVDYLRIVGAKGFEVVYEEEFEDNTVHKQKGNKLYVLFNYDLGILIKFDTFYQDSVNGGNMWYNWSPDSDDFHGCLSSGHFYFPKDQKHIGLISPDLKNYKIPNYPEDAEWNEDWGKYRKLQDPIDQEQKRLINEAKALGNRIVWTGYHDCREGVLTNIARMEKYGCFLPKWIEPYDSLWLTTYADWNNNGNRLDIKGADNITARRIAKLPARVRQQIGM